MNKKLELVGGIVFLVGISAYMYIAGSSEEPHTQIVQSKESFFSCGQCGKQFAMTTGEARSQMQTGQHNYICPACDDSGAAWIHLLPATDKGSADAKEKKNHPRPGGVRQPVEQ